MRATLPLTPYPVVLTLTDSRETFQRRSGVSGEGKAGMVYAGPRGWVLGWFDGDAYTLIHEATHVALFLAEHVGIEPFSSSGEPLAYLVEDIVRRCMKAAGREDGI